MKFASGDAVTNGSIVGHDTETSQGAKHSGTVAYNTLSDGLTGNDPDRQPIQQARVPALGQPLAQAMSRGSRIARGTWLWPWLPHVALALVAVLALLVGAVVPGGSTTRSGEGQ